MAINQNPFLATNRFGDEKIVMDEILWADVTVAPAATGNTGALPRYEKMPDGTVYLIDSDGRAEKVSSAVFKELNQWHVDKNGNDTTGTGADEAPYLTVTKALSVVPTADAVVVTEGTYAEAVTMSVANTTLRGEGNEYGGLTEINSLAVTTATGTSNRVSSLTVLGNLTHSGGAPLYISDTTVNGNYVSTSAAYEEIRQSRIQDGTITKTTAGTLYIKDSLIGNATFSTPNTIIALDNVTIDPGDVLTIGAGVIYSLNDVRGHVVIDPAAIPAATAALGGGLTGLAAKSVETATFNDVRLTNVPTITTATKVLVRDADGVVSEQTLSAASTRRYTQVTATAGQTTYTLPSTPIGSSTLASQSGIVHVTRNGVTISGSWSWVGAVGTYTPSDNYGCVIDVSDKLEFHWEAAV